MSVTLSKPYDNMNEAAMGGFKKILANGTDWQIKEFGFWVVVKVNDQKQAKFHYTPIVEGTSNGVALVKPSGLSVRAHCHSHTQSVKTGDFSADDLANFKTSSTAIPGLVWYPMNPYQQLRRANEAGDFPTGKDVKWAAVTP